MDITLDSRAIKNAVECDLQDTPARNNYIQELNLVNRAIMSGKPDEFGRSERGVTGICAATAHFACMLSYLHTGFERSILEQIVGLNGGVYDSKTQGKAGWDVGIDDQSTNMILEFFEAYEHKPNISTNTLILDVNTQGIIKEHGIIVRTGGHTIFACDANIATGEIYFIDQLFLNSQKGFVIRSPSNRFKARKSYISYA